MRCEDTFLCTFVTITLYSLTILGVGSAHRTDICTRTLKKYSYMNCLLPCLSSYMIYYHLLPFHVMPCLHVWQWEENTGDVLDECRRDMDWHSFCDSRQGEWRLTQQWSSWSQSRCWHQATLEGCHSSVLLHGCLVCFFWTHSFCCHVFLLM